MDLRGKTVILRVDWNLSLCGSKKTPKDVSKIEESFKTIKSMLDSGVNSIHVLTHQGRRGSASFASTKLHADVLRSMLSDHSYSVVYSGSFSNGYPNVARALMRSRQGEVYVWDNVRKLDDETDSFKDVKRKDLKKETKKRIREVELFNTIRQFCKPEDTVYVNDAFATHHRMNHLTIGPLARALKDHGYGFHFGPKFESEMRKIDRLRKRMKKNPANFVFGGSKTKDYVLVIPKMLDRYRKSEVFTSGPLALTFIKYAINRDIGRRNEGLIREISDNGLSREVIKIYEKYKKRIHLPSTFMVIKNGHKVANGREIERDIDSLKDTFVVDLGNQTISEYTGIIRGRGKAVNLINGGCGFHQKGFVNGTYKMLKNLKSNGSYVVIVGGDANSTWQRFGKKLGKPNLRSTAGKAFLNAIVEDSLPLEDFMN